MPAPIVKADDWKELQRVLDAIYDRSDTLWMQNRDMENKSVDQRVLADNAVGSAQIIDGSILYSDLVKSARARPLVLSAIPGPLPLGPYNFTTYGGRCIGLAHATGWSTAAGFQVGSWMRVDGVNTARPTLYFNVANVHHALSVVPFDLGFLAPGVHTYDWQNSGATNDGSDTFSLFLLELGIDT